MTDMGMVADRTGIGNPYPGIRPFGEDEQEFFFGRDLQVADIIRRLRSHHVAAVVGGSGCGKSSLVRAGVLPELRSFAMEDCGDFWLPVIFTPGTEPMANLARALHKSIDEARYRQKLVEQNENPHEDQVKLIVRKLRLGWSAFMNEFSDVIRVPEGLESLRPQANFVVVVDQFEEIFREQTEPGEAQRLVQLIIDAHDPGSRHPRVFIILTMRTENMHQCANYLQLPNVLNESAYLARRLDEDEVEEAILSPAKVIIRKLCDDILNSISPAAEEMVAAVRRQMTRPRDTDVCWPFEISVLIELQHEVHRISDDQDHLPLLQHLLSRLWVEVMARLEREESKPGAECALKEAIADSQELRTRYELLDEQAKQAANRAYRRLAMWEQPDIVTQKDLRAAIGKHETRGSSGLRQCLANSADGLFNGLDERARKLAEGVFSLLAQMDDNAVFKRRWTDRKEIADVTGASDQEIDDTIAVFTKTYPFIRESEGQIDVSHEALIRSWKTLRTWIENERSANRAFERGFDEYVEWSSGFTDPALATIRKKWIKWFGRMQNRTLHSFGEGYHIAARGLRWAKRYTFAIRQHYSQGARSKELLKGLTDDQIYTKTVEFYRRSRFRRRFSVGLFVVVAFVIVSGGTVLFLMSQETARLSDVAWVWKTQARVYSPYNPDPSFAGEKTYESLYKLAVALYRLRKQEDQIEWQNTSALLLVAHRQSRRAASARVRAVLLQQLWPDDQPDNGVKPSPRARERTPVGDVERECFADALDGITNERFDIAKQSGVPVSERVQKISAEDLKIYRASSKSARRVILVTNGGGVTESVWFGRDEFGRDDSCRIIRGARIGDRAYVAVNRSLSLFSVQTPQIQRAAARGQWRTNVFRVHWASFCNGKELSCREDEWQVETQIVASPIVDGLLTFDDSDGNLLRVRRNGPTSGSYRVYWDGIPMPVDSSEAAGYFSAKSNFPDTICARTDTSYMYFDACQPGKGVGNGEQKDGNISWLLRVELESATDGSDRWRFKSVTGESARALILESPPEQTGGQRSPRRRIFIHGGESQFREARKYPVVSLDYYGPPVRGLAFGTGSKQGVLYIEASGNRFYKVDWDLKNLRKRICEILPDSDGTSPCDWLMEERFRPGDARVELRGQDLRAGSAAAGS